MHSWNQRSLLPRPYSPQLCFPSVPEGPFGTASSSAPQSYPGMPPQFVRRFLHPQAPNTEHPVPRALRHLAGTSGSASVFQTDCCLLHRSHRSGRATPAPSTAAAGLLPFSSPPHRHNCLKTQAIVQPAGSPCFPFLFPHRQKTGWFYSRFQTLLRSAFSLRMDCRSSLPAPARRGAPGGTARSGPAICPDNPGSAVPGSAPTATVRSSAARRPRFLQTVPVHRSHPRGRTRCAAPPAAAAAWRRPVWASRPQGPHTRVHGAGRRSAKPFVWYHPVSAPGPTVPAAG